MAVATFPGTVARPISGVANWKDTLSKYTAFKNWWTLVDVMATPDAVTGFPRMKPRIGTLDMTSTGALAYAADGGYNAASFAGTAGQPVLAFDTAKLTGFWTIAVVRKARAIDTEDWGISLADADPSVAEGSGGRIFNVARQTNGTSNVRGLLINPSVNSSLVYPNAPALNTRDVAFVSIDFTNGVFNAAHFNDAPTTATWTQYPTLLNTSAATWQWTVGQGQGNQPFNGTVLDFGLIQGNIFDNTTSMNALKADFIRYASGYAV